MYSFHGMTMCSDTNCPSVPMKEGENEFGEPISNLCQEASKIFNKGVINLDLWLLALWLPQKHQ